MTTTKLRSVLVFLLAGGMVSAWSTAAHADEPAGTGEPAPLAPPPAASPPEAAPPAPPPAQAAPPTPPSLTAPKVTFSGYVEAYYSYNLNRPSNGLANYRWLDDRHNTFQLSTVVLDAVVDAGEFNAHAAVQAGPTADGWYAESGEARPGAAGAAATGAVTWHHIQQANVGWKAPVGSGLLLQAGLFLTPIGYEVPAVKDNFNWSRSNLFFGLPFYHAGVRASYDLSERWNASAWLVNGWNSATDSNDGKSVIAQVTYKVPNAISASVLYMGGPERRAGSPEGPAWRHLFDAFVQLDLDPRFSVAAHVDGGFEQNRFGTHSWTAAALYARAHPLPFLYLAARGDAFMEDVAANAQGRASTMFFGTDVYGLTGTIDVRPVPDHLSIRAEYRHDIAGAPLYFAQNATMDPTTKMDAANARTQDTLTLGVTGWF